MIHIDNKLNSHHLPASLKCTELQRKCSSKILACLWSECQKYNQNFPCQVTLFGCQICKDEVSGHSTDMPARLGISVVEKGSCKPYRFRVQIQETLTFFYLKNGFHAISFLLPFRCFTAPQFCPSIMPALVPVRHLWEPTEFHKLR